jgi:hypothetical protein
MKFRMRRALGKGLITTLGVPQHALRRPPDLARGAACGFGFSLAASEVGFYPGGITEISRGLSDSDTPG